MAFAEGQRGHDLGYDAPHELLRLVEGVEGTVELELELAPRAEYGLVRPLFRQVDDGGRTFGGPEPDRGQRRRADRGRGRRRCARASPCRAGEQVGFALRWARGREPGARCRTRPSGVAAAHRGHRRGLALVGGRARHLRGPAPRARPPQLARAQGPHLPARPARSSPPRRRSLPETVGGERNWDYRYAWIRDASLTLEALYIGACSDEAEDFVSFMTSSAGGRAGEGSLQIMYGIGGEHDLSERELPHLRGWRDSAPGARRQRRLGPDAARRLRRAAQRAPPLPRAARRAAPRDPAVRRRPRRHRRAALDARRTPGMWEMRGEPRHHLSSKVLCWTALDRAVKLAPALGEHAKVEEWARRARPDPRGRARRAAGARSARRYAQSFDSDELDAAQLLMPILGFLPATDERMRSTIDAIARDLTEDGLVLRYRNEEGLNADGLEGEEGTFVICSFWLVSCLAQAGEVDRAQELLRPARRLRQRPRPARRGDRHRERRAARQLPAGVQPHRADHRRPCDRQGPRRVTVVVKLSARSGRRP